MVDEQAKYTVEVVPRSSGRSITHTGDTGSVSFMSDNWISVKVITQTVAERFLYAADCVQIVKERRITDGS